MSGLAADQKAAVFALASLFVPGAPGPLCLDAADVNDDGDYDVSDAVYALASLFVPGAPEPPAPGPGACEPDPSADGLRCVLFSACP